MKFEDLKIWNDIDYLGMLPVYILQIDNGNGREAQPSQYFDWFSEALDAANKISFDGNPNGDDPLTKDDIRDWSDKDKENYHLKVYIIDEYNDVIVDWSVYKNFTINNPV